MYYTYISYKQAWLGGENNMVADSFCFCLLECGSTVRATQGHRTATTYFNFSRPDVSLLPPLLFVESAPAPIVASP